MEDLKNVETEFKRISGDIYEIVTIKNDQGQVVQTLRIPVKVEMKLRDMLQVLIGASILAVPVAFTEEVWNLGKDLPWLNTIILSTVGYGFMSAFIYFSAYRKKLIMFRGEFLKRVFLTFIISVIIVGFLLTVVDKCPWFTEFDVALKRTLIGAFPASLSASLTDSLN